jgi:hypothetical protein
VPQGARHRDCRMARRTEREGLSGKPFCFWRSTAVRLARGGKALTLSVMFKTLSFALALASQEAAAAPARVALTPVAPVAPTPVAPVAPTQIAPLQPEAEVWAAKEAAKIKARGPLTRPQAEQTINLSKRREAQIMGFGNPNFTPDTYPEEYATKKQELDAKEAALRQDLLGDGAPTQIALLQPVDPIWIAPLRPSEPYGPYNIPAGALPGTSPGWGAGPIAPLTEA